MATHGSVQCTGMPSRCSIVNFQTACSSMARAGSWRPHCHVRKTADAIRPMMRRRTAESTIARASRSGASTQIKICGVTNAEDAAAAADAGADFIGMIMWPKAKRGVSDDAAAAIANEALKRGAQPVGVFVDEDAETINARCARAGIPVAQLHGDGARAALSGLSPSLHVVWVLHCKPGGEVVTPLADEGGRQPDWVLLDGLQGGSGQVLDWTKLSPPPSCEGWLLAGGLKPDNVAAAVATARPSIVDVSSGVCGPDGLKKDIEMISAFVQAVKNVG